MCPGEPEWKEDVMNYYINQKAQPQPHAFVSTNQRAVERAMAFHRTIPGYQPTPLVSLPALARELGVDKLWVKDESKRFGLNAFKALGGSYAIARWMGERLGLEDGTLTFEALTAPESREKLGEVTFVTATDGNHGRGVAWAARELGQRAVVYLPKGSAWERLENIRTLGAQAEITELNYDDAVRLAAQKSEENGWVLIQDTAWPGYEQIPAWIMAGYTTLAGEIFTQLEQAGEEPPTHLFLQAGVGSFAGAVLGSALCRWGRSCPVTCIVEPDRADCLYRTAKAADGKLHPVTGAMDSMMAGLCCGEPCTLAWDILGPCTDAFLSCSDDYAALGMRLLGRPRGSDPVIISGESGAVGVGVLAAILQEEALHDLRWTLGLGERSRVLCISTEGDTDRANYRKILEDDR